MLTPEMERALRTAGRKVAEWTAERDRLVREAVAAGGSYRAVGEAAGISHTAVKFIAKGRP
jgi:homoserine acetyltransferase